MDDSYLTSTTRRWSLADLDTKTHIYRAQSIILTQSRAHDGQYPLETIHEHTDSNGTPVVTCNDSPQGFSTPSSNTSLSYTRTPIRISPLKLEQLDGADDTPPTVVQTPPAQALMRRRRSRPQTTPASPFAARHVTPTLKSRSMYTGATTETSLAQSLPSFVPSLAAGEYLPLAGLFSMLSRVFPQTMPQFVPSASEAMEKPICEDSSAPRTTPFPASPHAMAAVSVRNLRTSAAEEQLWCPPWLSPLCTAPLSTTDAHLSLLRVGAMLYGMSVALPVASTVEALAHTPSAVAAWRAWSRAVLLICAAASVVCNWLQRAWEAVCACLLCVVAGYRWLASLPLAAVSKPQRPSTARAPSADSIAPPTAPHRPRTRWRNGRPAAAMAGARVSVLSDSIASSAPSTPTLSPSPSPTSSTHSEAETSDASILGSLEACHGHDSFSTLPPLPLPFSPTSTPQLQPTASVSSAPLSPSCSLVAPNPSASTSAPASRPPHEWLPVAAMVISLILLRELVVAYAYSLLNKALALASKHLLRGLISELAGDRDAYRVAFTVPLPWGQLDYAFVLTEAPLFFCVFTLFSFCFSSLRTGAIINPCTAVHMACSRALYRRFTLAIIATDVFAHYCALLTLYHLTPYHEALAPTRMRVALPAACLCEFLICFLNYSYQALTAHRPPSVRKTFTNVLVRQGVFIIGFPFTRAVMNPASFLAAVALAITHNTTGESTASVLLLYAPSMLAYVLAPMCGTASAVSVVRWLQRWYDTAYAREVELQRCERGDVDVRRSRVRARVHGKGRVFSPIGVPRALPVSRGSLYAGVSTTKSSSGWSAANKTAVVVTDEVSSGALYEKRRSSTGHTGAAPTSPLRSSMITKRKSSSNVTLSPTVGAKYSPFAKDPLRSPTRGMGSPETAIRRYFRRRQRRERWGIAAPVVEVLGGLLNQELEAARVKKTEAELASEPVINAVNVVSQHTKP